MKRHPGEESRRASWTINSRDYGKSNVTFRMKFESVSRRGNAIKNATRRGHVYERDEAVSSAYILTVKP